MDNMLLNAMLKKGQTAPLIRDAITPIKRRIRCCLLSLNNLPNTASNFSLGISTLFYYPFFSYFLYYSASILLPYPSDLNYSP